MIVLPAGSFEMGSPESDPARTADEQPRHRVAFARPFAVAKYAVTRGEFARFVAESGYRVAPGCLILRNGSWVDDRRAGWRRPGFAQTERDPVVCMSWNDGEAYAELAQPQDRPRVRAAHRGAVGIRRARRDHDAILLGRAGEPRLRQLRHRALLRAGRRGQ